MINKPPSVIAGDVNHVMNALRYVSQRKQVCYFDTQKCAKVISRRLKFVYDILRIHSEGS